MIKRFDQCGFIRIAKPVTEIRCKHCNETIEDNGSGWVHTSGQYQIGMHRCALDPYGYDAAPVGVQCSFACLGSRHNH